MGTRAPVAKISAVNCVRRREASSSTRSATVVRADNGHPLHGAHLTPDQREQHEHRRGETDESKSSQRFSRKHVGGARGAGRGRGLAWRF